MDILPAPGHFYGTLKLALILKKAGHQIIYLNMDMFRKELKEHNFTIINLPFELKPPFNLTKIIYFRNFKKC